jgi:hypothetical protein
MQAGIWPPTQVQEVQRQRGKEITGIISIHISTY